LNEKSLPNTLFVSLKIQDQIITI